MDNPESFDEVEIDPVAARNLTILRYLVTTLTVVMIVGFLVMIGAFVTRFPDAPETAAPVAFDLPASITLPDGTTPTAFTRGDDWVAIVGETAEGSEILIFDAKTGVLRQTVGVE